MNKEQAKKSRFKIKRNILIVSIFVMLVITVSLYISFSYYTRNESNLIYKGIATTSTADIDIKLYLEDTDASGNGLGTYNTRVFFAPSYGYTYNESLTECSDGITLVNTVDGFDITATKKGKCKVYYDRVPGSTNDVVTNIYVSDDGVNYHPVSKVPTDGYIYSISDKTNCTNGATATINNNEIEITTSALTLCNVYINKTNSKTLARYMMDFEAHASSEELRNYDGYRYANKTNIVYNYVSFNNQLWNAIGTFNVEFDSNGDGVVDSSGYLAKLVYAENDITMAWDTNNSNTAFENTTLGQYLNTNVLSDASNNMVVDAKWYIPTFTEDDYSVAMVSSFISKNVSDETMIAKVAIPYITDFIYSTKTYSINDYTIMTYNDFYEPLRVSNSSYIFRNAFTGDFIMFLARYTEEGGEGYRSLSDPYDENYCQYNEEGIAYPTVYLKSGIYITGGTGTKLDPLILSN